MNCRACGGLPAVVCTVAMILAGCEGGAPQILLPPLSSSMGFGWAVPDDVQRIAVFYPRSSNPDFSEAYQRLEGAVFQLKGQRPTLRIVDRFNLPILRSEQQLQHAGPVTDDSAVRIGRLLGVDSVVLYSIEGPTLRDRFFAGRPSQLRPITVTTKIVRVETAEVVYHNVVTARMDDGDRWGWSLSDSMDAQQLGREALDRGIRQTLFDLQRAFE